MRLIDADRFEAFCYDVPMDVDADSFMRGVEFVLDIIDDQPTLDIVFCKYCKHYDSHNHRCKVWNHGIGMEDFCSHGERKEE